VKAIVKAHGGTVEKFIGDAVMAVFGVPQVAQTSVWFAQCLVPPIITSLQRPR
jgi:class 3 adenylate cyclase